MKSILVSYEVKKKRVDLDPLRVPATAEDELRVSTKEHTKELFS